MKQTKLLETRHHPEIDEKFHQLNVGNIGSVLSWWEFLRMVARVAGDIVECGVGRGRSLLSIVAINWILDQDEGGQRVVFGYDSFEGFPAPTAEDASPRHPQQGEWSRSPSGKYRYSPELTRTVLTEAGLPLEEMDVRLVKGFFGESLKSHPDRAIALLHLDGDLYRSYLDCLELLYHKVSPGGIIVFDDLQEGDLDADDFPGSRRAVREFLGEEKYQHLEVGVGGTFFHVKE